MLPGFLQGDLPQLPPGKPALLQGPAAALDCRELRGSLPHPESVAPKGSYLWSARRPVFRGFPSTSDLRSIPLMYCQGSPVFSPVQNAGKDQSPPADSLTFQFERRGAALRLRRRGRGLPSRLRHNPLRLFNRHSGRKVAELDQRPISSLCPSADVDSSITAGTGNRADNINPPSRGKPYPLESFCGLGQ